MFDIGRVRFLMTDDRSERHASKDTMLGPRQVEWLLGEFERAVRDAVPLLAWVNSVPWITADGDLRTFPFHMPLEPEALSGMDGFYAARLRRRSGGAAAE